MRETKKLPLVVDLDGTLTVSDTLMESVIRVVKRKPVNLLRLPFWLAGGRAAFKAKVAEHADFRAETLPYRESLVDFLTCERESGRKIVLATAAHRSIADRVSTHLGLFDRVIATNDDTNLKGEAKLACIRQQIGDDFVYAGDSKADLPVWAGAKGAILAGVSSDVAADVRSYVPIEHEFANVRATFSTWCKALRVGNPPVFHGVQK
ncbi:haloacid dehalogenase-like hydrolase [Burkholderia ambifaria]|uniref:haloacid dehalogenase-like hydrolase n=1 Tax=Burkholderia ambifaria TaxID=152480 RepID=UPI0020136E2F|nr:haloacid dehalogenase-like hydrolase [Burkholderia ambifaria]